MQMQMADFAAACTVRTAQQYHAVCTCMVLIASAESYSKLLLIRLVYLRQSPCFSVYSRVHLYRDITKKYRDIYIAYRDKYKISHIAIYRGSPDVYRVRIESN